MIRIGCHLSCAKGFFAMGKDALQINANTFQFFTRNPRGSKAKKINPEDINSLLNLMDTNNFTSILAHAPYTLNACSSDPNTRAFAAKIIAEDLTLMEYLPNNLYNFHPGNHVGQGIEHGIHQITTLLNDILKPEQTTTVLLETMSGKGTEVGQTFEEIRQIIDGVILSDKIGVCLDTCHVYDAGYDIVNDLDGVLNQFDEIIGLHRLKAVHLNDSKNSIGSHKDRHEIIGQGYIGLDALEHIINHPRLLQIPFYLETPNDLMGHAEEISTLRNLYRK